MKCQILFSGKNKKSISLCCLLKVLPKVLNVNYLKLFFVFVIFKIILGAHYIC